MSPTVLARLLENGILNINLCSHGMTINVQTSHSDPVPLSMSILLHIQILPEWLIKTSRQQLFLPFVEKTEKELALPLPQEMHLSAN